MRSKVFRDDGEKIFYKGKRFCGNNWKEFRALEKVNTKVAAFILLIERYFVYSPRVLSIISSYQFITKYKKSNGI